MKPEPDGASDRDRIAVLADGSAVTPRSPDDRDDLPAGPGPARPHDTGGPRPPAPSRGAAVWRAKWWILLVGLLAGGGAYAISGIVPATYEASATMRVVSPASMGAPESSVLASNELASQYAELGDSGPVIAAAARTLGVRPDRLSGAISSGTVNSQNLVEVTARAPRPGQARARATAVARAMAAYLRDANARAARGYSTAAQPQLAPLDRQISRARRDLDLAIERSASVDTTGLPASQGDVASRQALLTTLITQREQLGAALAQNAVALQPQVERFAAASGATQTQPRPVLYALVAFLAGLLVTAEVAVLVRTRAR